MVTLSAAPKPTTTASMSEVPPDIIVLCDTSDDDGDASTSARAVYRKRLRVDSFNESDTSDLSQSMEVMRIKPDKSSAGHSVSSPGHSAEDTPDVEKKIIIFPFSSEPSRPRKRRARHVERDINPVVWEIQACDDDSDFEYMFTPRHQAATPTATTTAIVTTKPATTITVTTKSASKTTTTTKSASQTTATTKSASQTTVTTKSASKTTATTKSASKTTTTTKSTSKTTATTKSASKTTATTKSASTTTDASPQATVEAVPKVDLKAMFERSKIERMSGVFDLPRRVIPDSPLRTARVVVPHKPELVPATWPSTVIYVAMNHNPSNIAFPFVQTRGKCGCKKHGDCWNRTCTNASVGIFCDALYCPWRGICSNGTRQSEHVSLMRFRGTDNYTVQATARLNEGVVIGEYLGELSYQPRDLKKREVNEGYRLHFHSDRDAWGSKDVCVNALIYGTLMRFVNHSCTPNAIFNEVGNGHLRTMTVVTRRVIFPGEEIFCDYGAERWFDCRCDSCEHKTREMST